MHPPAWHVEPWAWDMLRLWRLSQGGMARGWLPDPGGTLDQPRVMLEAFAVMSAVEHELTKRDEDREKEKS